MLYVPFHRIPEKGKIHYYDPSLDTQKQVVSLTLSVCTLYVSKFIVVLMEHSQIL